MVIDFKKVKLNAVFLTLSQLSNYLVPLIVTPYLVSQIGVSKVGVINFSLAIITYFIIASNFGYNFTGVKFVSNQRDEPLKLSSYLTVSFILRIVLLLISLMIFFILSLFYETIAEKLMPVVLFLGVVVGNIMYPVWYFQGIENMKWISIFNFLSKITTIILIYTFVDKSSNPNDVILINSTVSIFSGLASLYVIFVKMGVKVNFHNIKNNIREHISSGKSIYLQQIYVCFYGPLALILVGVNFGDYWVGVFSITERIVGVPIMLAAIINQAFYPQSVILAKKSLNDYFRFIYINLFLLFFFSLLFIFIVYFFEDVILNYFYGSIKIEYSNLLCILLIGVLFSSSGQFFTQTFVTLGIEKVLTKISLTMMILSLVLLPYISKNYDVYHVAYFVVLRQALVFFICIYVLSKRKFYVCQ